MPNSHWRNVILVVLLSLLVAGCSGQAGAASPRNVEKQKSSPDTAPLTAASESTASAVAAANAEFKPPFPNRQELFLPPEKHEAKPEQPIAKRPAIQVKGFANADGLLALLVIDGKLTALRVGESRDKIEVLSIKPPKVMLRHEGQSWFESLLAAGSSSENGSAASQSN